jgi:hypothetical protein
LYNPFFDAQGGGGMYLVMLSVVAEDITICVARWMQEEDSEMSNRD